MSCYTFTAIVTAICIKISRAAWVVPNEYLPRDDDEMAVAEYNGKILLIGGHYYPKQGVEIAIDTHKVTDLGSEFLPSDSPGGRGQFWTQQAHIVYIITSSTFDTFNLATRQYTTDWRGIQFNTFADRSCVASSETFLYVIGGEDAGYTLMNVVQILSLSTYSWMNDPPSMQTARRSHACLVYNEYLWAFGGRSDAVTGYEDPSSERIQTTNIAQNTWRYITGELTLGLRYIRAVSWHDTIYIVGGKYDYDAPHNWVHLVDANTGTVSLSPDRLPWLCDYGSPIIVDSIFYVFGCDADVVEWAYYILQPVIRSTTATPSNDPTKTSTTLNPTKMATNDPTKRPTANPTTRPTTTRPSSNPSVQPTGATTSPTQVHIKDSTGYPMTVPPSLPPTRAKRVTVSPTVHPTKRPTLSAENVAKSTMDYDSGSGDATSEPTQGHMNRDIVLILVYSIGALITAGCIPFICYKCGVKYMTRLRRNKTESINIEMNVREANIVTERGPGMKEDSDATAYCTDIYVTNVETTKSIEGNHNDNAGVNAEPIINQRREGSILHNDEVHMNDEGMVSTVNKTDGFKDDNDYIIAAFNQTAQGVRDRDVSTAGNIANDEFIIKGNDEPYY